MMERKTRRSVNSKRPVDGIAQEKPAALSAFKLMHGLMPGDKLPAGFKPPMDVVDWGVRTHPILETCILEELAALPKAVLQNRDSYLKAVTGLRIRVQTAVQVASALQEAPAIERAIADALKGYREKVERSPFIRG